MSRIFPAVGLTLSDTGNIAGHCPAPRRSANSAERVRIIRQPAAENRPYAEIVPSFGIRSFFRSDNPSLSIRSGALAVRHPLPGWIPPAPFAHVLFVAALILCTDRACPQSACTLSAAAVSPAISRSRPPAGSSAIGRHRIRSRDTGRKTYREAFLFAGYAADRKATAFRQRREESGAGQTAQKIPIKQVENTCNLTVSSL